MPPRGIRVKARTAPALPPPPPPFMGCQPRTGIVE